VPGFVANASFDVMSNESDWAIAHNEAKTALEVDSALKFKLGLRWGLLELEDTSDPTALSMSSIMSWNTSPRR